MHVRVERRRREHDVAYDDMAYLGEWLDVGEGSLLDALVYAFAHEIDQLIAHAPILPAPVA
jgi:hypothetical protein